MAYYWCSLTFDEVGTLLERNSIVYGETEQEFIRNKLILDSKGMLRAKYSAGFFCAYQLDPKFYKSENNWKENKKCRHQWECHSNPHADTIPA